ncbi:hypothetical protein KSP40_PGU015278 [Platanthera guangdongensis]|uniref:Lipoprotein n=1 Tax=Platanthera guangdongensis TaxID=2320717 RepID=A0ABR2LY52_9ASPA
MKPVAGKRSTLCPAATLIGGCTIRPAMSSARDSSISRVASASNLKPARKPACS